LIHPALDLHGAAHGIHHTRKFRQEAVALVLYDPAPVLGDLRINQLPEMRFQPLVIPARRLPSAGPRDKTLAALGCANGAKPAVSLPSSPLTWRDIRG
jgi:hypothetical protein